MAFLFSKSNLAKTATILIIVVIIAGIFALGYFSFRQKSTPTNLLTPSPTLSPSPTSALTPTSKPSTTSSPTPKPTASSPPIQVFTTPTVVPTAPTSAPTATPNPVLTWSKTYGGTNSDFGYSVIQSSDGGYVIAGQTAVYGSNYFSDVFLIKTDLSGNLLWNKTYGGTNSDLGNSVIQSSDGGYIVAGYTYSYGAGSSDVYLIKTDSTGNLLWNKTYGGTGDDLGNSVIQSSDGGYIVAGYTYSYGAGISDVYLIKTDPNGNLQWNKTYGGTSSDQGYSVIQSSDGGYIVAGSTYSFGEGYNDVYLLKTDLNGNLQWNKTYGGTSYDLGYSVIQSSDGGYTVAGYTHSYGAGSDDVYLIKTDPTGNLQWNKTYGGTNSDFGYSVIQTSDGGYAIAGYTDSFEVGHGDIYLIKTDFNGNFT